MESEILKYLDVNDSNKWIVHDSSLFFSWISNNLDVTNIVSNSDKLTYAELAETHPEHLEQQLRDIEYEFPGFFSLTERDLIEKQKEAALLEVETIERNDRMIRMKEYERTMIKALTKMEEEKIESDLELKFLTEEVERKMVKLETLRKGNAKKIDASNKHLLQSPSAFMYQMPSDKFQNAMNKFCMSLDVLMRQNLDIRKEPHFHETDQSLIQSMTKERNKIMELEGKILESELNNAGLNYAMENVDSHLKFFKENAIETNEVINDWTNEEEIMKEQFEVSLVELQMLIRQQSQSSLILDDLGQKKQAQNMDVLKKLARMQIITDDVASICCALWTASQLDVKRLENRVDNSEETENNVYECRKRVCQLERYSKSDSKTSFNDIILQRFQDILRKKLSLSTEKLTSVESCVGEILSFQERLSVITKSIVDQKYLARILNSINDIELQSLKLHPYIYNGPLYKPCLYDSTFFTQIHEKDKRKKELEEQWQDIRSQFQNNINDPFNNDKFYRMKELLATWFLTEPRKVILAIKEVHKRAAELGSTSYKALNVTIADRSKLN